MKKTCILVILVMLVPALAFAAPFSPTLLKLSASPVVQYDFDGSTLSIPVTVTGTDAALVFCVFTRGKASVIPNMINGYLGWHQVNKIDTCVYYAPTKSVAKGATNLTWDGKDQDGSVVAAGEYTYYIWAFDNQGKKTPMYKYAQARSLYYEIQETDEDGMPMANPLYYELDKRWTVGNDPMDSTLTQGSKVSFAQGWARRYTTALDPRDFDYFYVKVLNGDAGTAAITKYKWVPNGDCEFQTDFGDEGYSTTISTPAGGSDTGVCTDGTYIYTTDRDSYNTDFPVDFYMFDMEGLMVSTLDLQKWWSSPEEQALGAQANGGPNSMMIRNGMIFLNCHCSCLKQMVDPARYLESQESDDFFVWSNGNGDYTLDHNFEETAKLKWVCMDYNVGPYTYGIDADDMLFSLCPAYDVGAVSFGLMAPDGTGLGYFAFSGETAGWKKGTTFIDSGTPYDGIYTDNEQTGGAHYAYDNTKREAGLFFLGHDAISGIITSAVGVEDAAPAAFAVAQNTPNPFNPTTTISFSLVNAGNVTVEIFNVAGQKVETLANGFMAAGSHSVVWDASRFSAGVYFYTVKTGSLSRTMKMTLVK